jgi:hypothetical protein
MPGGARRYDIIEGDGHMVASVEIPPERRVIAISRQWVHLVHTDADGAEFVERYLLPQ